MSSMEEAFQVSWVKSRYKVRNEERERKKSKGVS